MNTAGDQQEDFSGKLNKVLAYAFWFFAGGICGRMVALHQTGELIGSLALGALMLAFLAWQD